MDYPMYEYQQLPSSRSIRLVSLITHKTGSAMFECALHSFDLDATNIPRYLALSYTWQTPEIEGAELIKRPSNPCLVIDGQTVPISETLFDFFDQLFEGDGDDPIIFWIDAICINQQDLAERSSQVEMMREIYEGAQLVYVWLGLHDDDSRTSIPIIELIVQGVEDLDISRESSMSVRPFATAQDYQSASLPYVSDEAWESIARFFERGWFHRIWTVQEVILAQDAVLICGDSIIAWDDVVVFVGIAFLTGLFTKLLFAQQNEYTARKHTINGIKDAASLKGTMNARKEPDENSDVLSYFILGVFRHTDEDSFVAAKLAWILNLSRRRASTDARDRIYALKPLATRYHEPHDWRRLESNYVKSKETVFTETTRYIVEKLGNLSFLSFVEDGLGRRGSALPSWVPDFSQKSSSLPLLSYGSYDCFHDYPGQAYLNPAKHVSVAVQNSLTLSVKGIVLAGVEAVSIPWETTLSSNNLSPFLEFASTLIGFTHASESLGEALMKTLAAGIGQRPESVWNRNDNGSFEMQQTPFKMFVLLQISSEIHNWIVDYSGSYDKWWDERKHLETFCNQEASLPSRSEFDVYFVQASGLLANAQFSETLLITEDANLFEQLFQPQKAYSDSLLSSLPGRRLFRTTRHNLGLASVSASPGDEIWMLHGSKVPFVLRRRLDSSYEFIGEAYIHGFMHGEAFKINKNLSDQVQEIILR